MRWQLLDLTVRIVKIFRRKIVFKRTLTFALPPCLQNFTNYIPTLYIGLYRKSDYLADWLRWEFLVGFPLEKPTIEFARRSAVEVGSTVVSRFMTPGFQKYSYRKFVYLYVYVYVWIFPAVKATGRNFERIDLKF